MGSEPGPSEGKIRVDEHYPSEAEDGPPIDIKKIDNIRSNVKFDQCYEISKHIADGKFGKVFHVKDKASGSEYAAKFIKIRKEADRADVEREVSILTSLRHPRIAQIYDAFYTTTNEVVLIMEIVRGGELFDRVADETYVLTEQAVSMIVCQLCEAIAYIHQQNIIHLDVKPENIMCVTQKGNRIKLIDFGLARYYDGKQELKYMAGTPEFAAPEVIKYENLTYHTDMWSVGVITYILLSGESPFLGENLGETYCNVEKGVWEFIEEFDAVSPEAKDFISKLLVYDQKKRMLPAECLAHPWIATQRAKAMVDANLEKPAEGPPIDNRQMRGYNAKRKFRRMVIYVKFLIEMSRLRNSLAKRQSENAQKFFDPLFKMAEEKERKLNTVANALSNSSQTNKTALGTLVEASMNKKRTSLPSPVGNEEPASKTSTKMVIGELPPTVKSLEEPVVKKITKTIIDEKTGLPKTVTVIKRKSIKKTADDEKKLSIKRKGSEEKKEEPTVEKHPEIPGRTETLKKKKASIDLPGLPPIPPQDAPKRKSITKSLASFETTSTTSLPVVTAPKEMPKKKSVVLAEPPTVTVLSKPVESKFDSLLDNLKKRKSLPAKLPSITEPDPEPVKQKKSLGAVTSTTSATTLPSLPFKSFDEGAKDKITGSLLKPKKKSLVAAEWPPVQPKILESKEKMISTLMETPKKRKSVVILPKIEDPDSVPFKSTETLTLPRVEKKAQKSDSSDSTKENREDHPEKPPSRQGGIKKKDKLNADNVLNISSTRNSVDSTLSVTEKNADGKKIESILVRKKSFLKSTGEKDIVDVTKGEIKKEENKKGESLIKTRLSKLNGEAPPPQVNIMSVAQKTFAEEKKPSLVISMVPEKTTTTTTSTTTSVRRKASTTEKKVQLTSGAKTVEQVELTNSTHDKVKVSQITTKKEESPELEVPLTSVKKRVVKKDSLKSQSEKQRKEEEKTKEGSLVQVTKVLNDKTLNSVAVNEHTTLPCGTIKKISLTTSSEVNKELKGKAEAELTPKKLSLKKADFTLTENTRATLGSDINGNKTLLQKAHKTEIKIVPSSPTNLVSLVKVELPKEQTVTSTKRGSILSVPKEKDPRGGRDSSEERKTVRFSGNVKDETASPRSPGLIKTKSESSLNKKIKATVQLKETASHDDGEVKKRKNLLVSSKSHDTYIPKEDFSFSSLKDKLLRRVSTTEADLKREDLPKECVTVSKTHSVKDRLRMFEFKK